MAPDHLRAVDPFSAEWITIVLLLVIALLAMINVSSPRKWRLLAGSMFRMRLGGQALREEMDLQDRAFIGLLVAATAVLALFAWQTFEYQELTIGYPTLLGLVGGLMLGHYFILRSVGSMFNLTKGVEEYLYTGFLIFILTGILLLPLVTLIAFRSDLRGGTIVAGGVLVLFLLVYRWLRGAWIGTGEGLPLRYIILYFCAAELLPVLLALHHWRNVSSTLFHS